MQFLANSQQLISNAFSKVLFWLSVDGKRTRDDRYSIDRSKRREIISFCFHLINLHRLRVSICENDQGIASAKKANGADGADGTNKINKANKVNRANRVNGGRVNKGRADKIDRIDKIDGNGADEANGADRTNKSKVDIKKPGGTDGVKGVNSANRANEADRADRIDRGKADTKKPDGIDESKVNIEELRNPNLGDLQAERTKVARQAATRFSLFFSILSFIYFFPFLNRKLVALLNHFLPHLCPQ